VGERLDVGAVPEAGVGEDDLGRVGDAGRLEFLAGGGDNRLEAVALVAASDDVGGDDDLPFGGDGLRGVALQKAAGRLDRPRVRIGDVDAPRRRRRDRPWLPRRTDLRAPWNVHASSGLRGVDPADTGKSSTTCWPGVTRAQSTCGRRPGNHVRSATWDSSFRPRRPVA
jgi:hypothetical protein